MSNNMTYKEKREKVLKDMFKPLIEGSGVYGDTINIDVVKRLTEQVKTRRPVTDIHIYNKNFEGLFKTKKQYDRFFTTAMKLNDFNFRQDLYLTEKYSIFLNAIEFDDSIRILEKIANKGLSTHNVISNIPIRLKYPKLWPNYILRILDYSVPDVVLLKLINYSNYNRLLTAENKEVLLNELDFIETNKSLNMSDESSIPSYMLLNDFPNNDSFIKYTKSSNIITGIGADTQCCFRKGGVGESLMMISLKSPITGILYGDKLYSKTRWFAYVWEMVEYNKSTGEFDINLVLDNIESNLKLDINDFNTIAEELRSFNKYKKIYLGYLRNDIEIPSDIISTKKLKPVNITYFAKEVRKYSAYDDSEYIYTMIDRGELKGENIKSAISLGDYHRIKYIMDSKDILGEKLYLDDNNPLVNLKFNKKFKLNNLIDMEKSFVVRDDYSIKSFEIYDIDGNLFSKFN